MKVSEIADELVVIQHNWHELPADVDMCGIVRTTRRLERLRRITMLQQGWMILRPLPRLE